MKGKKNKILSIFCIIMLTILISLNSYAHSGRTDSSGGHKDNKNKSGLGSYHYHCGGNPPHLHENGCPYTSTKSTTSSSQSSSSKTTSQATSKSTATSSVENTPIKETEPVEVKTNTSENSNSNSNTSIEQNNITTNSLENNTNKSNNQTNKTYKEKEENNILGGVVAIALLGGGTYWAYQKYKKKSE